MNIAILIDAENVLPNHADLIFNHAQSLGTIVYKEIFGVAAALTTWVGPVLKYAIHPNLTIKASKGKNSSDISLVIGAMDLLVTGGIDCAIIASSDSDFSSLSVRLRNAGIEVIGMGTDKANALWRTACSSFVVLQNQKPAPQPAAQKPAQPAQSAEAPKQSAQQKKNGRAAAAPTHQERVAVIGQLIQKQLESHGGRLQTSTLFPLLNKLPEYQVDRQGSGKKPLNYLTSMYGDRFRFEDTPDGNNWISLPGVEPEKPAETSDDAPAVEAAEETPVVEAQEEAPAVEPEAEAPAEAARAEDEGDSESYVTPDEIVERLVAGGFDADIARQVTDIFADSVSYRSASTTLRSVFGSTAGRDYYHQAKKILSEE